MHGVGQLACKSPASLLYHGFNDLLTLSSCCPRGSATHPSSHSLPQIKPDYLSRVEIDALIIGCFWGEDRRAGLFSE